MQITQEDFEKLKELEESLWLEETRFDREYMSSILAPDFFEFGRSGRIYQRKETIAANPKQEIQAKLPLRDFKIHSIDMNVVLVTYISEVGINEVERGNRSSLWLKTETGWQLKFHQGTVVSE
jgi:hypothetical protein